MLDNRYEIILADTDESKNIHFNLRYRVYCLEKGFEEAKEFTNNLETDEYDENSAHFLIRCHATQAWIGTFRVVIDRFDQLPMSSHATISQSHWPSHGKPSAEFSRLAILRDFQTRKNGGITNVRDDCHIVMKAIHTGIRYAKSVGASEIVYFCQRSLGKVVNKMGVSVHQIGPGSNYRGLRYPYLSDLSDFPSKIFNSELTVQCFRQHSTYVPYSKYVFPRELAA